MGAAAHGHGAPGSAKRRPSRLLQSPSAVSNQAQRSRRLGRKGKGARARGGGGRRARAGGLMAGAAAAGLSEEERPTAKARARTRSRRGAERPTPERRSPGVEAGQVPPARNREKTEDSRRQRAAQQRRSGRRRTQAAAVPASDQASGTNGGRAPRAPGYGAQARCSRRARGARAGGNGARRAPAGARAGSSGAPVAHIRQAADGGARRTRQPPCAQRDRRARCAGCARRRRYNIQPGVVARRAEARRRAPRASETRRAGGVRRDAGENMNDTTTGAGAGARRRGNTGAAAARARPGAAARPAAASRRAAARAGQRGRPRPPPPPRAAARPWPTPGVRKRTPGRPARSLGARAGAPAAQASANDAPSAQPWKVGAEPPEAASQARRPSSSDHNPPRDVVLGVRARKRRCCMPLRARAVARAKTSSWARTPRRQRTRKGGRRMPVLAAMGARRYSGAGTSKRPEARTELTSIRGAGNGNRWPSCRRRQPPAYGARRRRRPAGAAGPQRGAVERPAQARARRRPPHRQAAAAVARQRNQRMGERTPRARSFRRQVAWARPGRHARARHDDELTMRKDDKRMTLMTE